jgi:CRP/FNR family cyclic AMP-dependent transcriptional regulator
MLRSVALFSELSEEHLECLTSRSTRRSYPKGAVIVNEGDDGSSLFVIETGSVKAYLRDEEDREVVLSTQGPGEYFGELAMFDDAPRSASVVAQEACKVIVISKAVLRQAIAEHPEISHVLLKGLALRVRALTENVRTLALLDVFGRLVRTLYAIASEKDGVFVIEQRLTHQELASRIGASREMVSRIMHDLVRGGYIRVDGGHISILRKIPANW